jgi:hypothetical protein
LLNSLQALFRKCPGGSNDKSVRLLRLDSVALSAAAAGGPAGADTKTRTAGTVRVENSCR